MCCYCNMGDYFSRFNPPYPGWEKQSPLIPSPIVPPAQIIPWSVEQLEKMRDLLKDIRDLESQVGCPCEPNKADYINLLEKRIEELKRQSGAA